MKLRSVLFTVVLLLLAATVCAAQSPMGFSPSEFFRDFVGVSTIVYDEPHCCYTSTDDDTGALITVGDYAYIYLTYSGDKVTEVDHAFIYTNKDQASTENAVYSVFTTFLTLAHITGAYDEAEDTDSFKAIFSELLEIGELDFLGYHMTAAAQVDGDSVTGLIRITKE